MDLQAFLVLYIIALPLCIAFDMLWRGSIASGYYAATLTGYTAKNRGIASFLYYALFVLGLVFFALYPAATRGTIVTAFILGGFFGLAVYGGHSLKNLSSFKEWPLGVTLIDMAWGAFLGGFVSVVAVAIQNGIL